MSSHSSHHSEAPSHKSRHSQHSHRSVSSHHTRRSDESSSHHSHRASQKPPYDTTFTFHKSHQSDGGSVISSRRSSVSSVSLHKLALESEKAELEVKLQSLKEIQSIEAERLRLKQLEEEVRLGEELALSAARSNVLDHLSMNDNKVDMNVNDVNARGKVNIDTMTIVV